MTAERSFGDWLRQRRLELDLTREELAHQVGCSTITLRKLESEERRPSKQMAERLADALKIPPNERPSFLRFTRGDPFAAPSPIQSEPVLLSPAELPKTSGPATDATVTAPEPGESPFKGLRYFNEADAELFFGRERLTARLVAHLRDQHFLAVVGASGSGKSSLVRAGLIPALARTELFRIGGGPLESGPDWDIHLITPTAHPLEALALSLTVDLESVTATATLIDDLAHDARGLHLAGRRLLNRHGGQRLLLVVDQFEELFTLCDADAERKAFVDNLLTAVTGDGPLVAAIALRADFYAQCGLYPGLRDALEKHQAYIGPMQADELRRAMEEPVKRGGWAWEPGLVDLLVHDATGDDEPGSLPLLSHALLETWKRREGRTLTFGGYIAAGGVRGAIAQTAQSVYETLSPEQQLIARGIFSQLTELGEGMQDTRRRATLAELLPRDEDDPAQRRTAEAVLKNLVDARLITMTQTTVEVAHEAVLHEWPTLREWLNDNREGLRLHRRLSEAAQAWDKADRDPGELYRAARLAGAQEWAMSPARVEPLTEIEREFLQASIEQLERESAERETQRRHELEAAQALAQAEQTRADVQAQSAARLRRRNRILTAVGVVALAVAVATGTFGVQANQSALQAEGRASRALSQQLAAEATNLLGTQPDLAALLSVEALRSADTVEARGSLLTVLQNFPASFLHAGRTTPGMIPAYSPNGRTLAVGSQDGTIRLFDAITFEPIGQPWTGHADWVSSLAISPDGKLLASGSDDNTMRVWDLASHREIGSPLTGQTGEWIDVAFSPDGKLLAANGPNSTVRLWDVAGAQPLGSPLSGHTDFVSYVAFSPDGKTLATSSFDQSVILWDVATRQPIGAPLASEHALYTVAFSPDGKTIATGDRDGVVMLWDTATRKAIGPPLAGHTAVVFTVAFSPDGRSLVSGGRDNTILLWDTASHQRVGQPLKMPNAVHRLLFSPDGKTLISGGFDNNLVQWQVTTAPALGRPLAGETGPASAVAFSPDGQWLAVGGQDGTIQLFDADTETAISPTLAGYTSVVKSLAFSANSQVLASVDGDGTIRLWNAQAGQAIGTSFAAHSGSVTGVTFSPVDNTLASGSSDGTVTLWDATTGQVLGLPLTGQGGRIVSVAFSPDGKTLAAGGEDADINLWDVSRRQLIGRPLTGHRDSITGIVFSPDGKRLASSASDQTIRLWDVETHQTIGRPLTGHFGSVTAVAFNSDGSLLASGSTDKTIRLWDLPSGQMIGQPVTGLENRVAGLAFSPDGKRLASVIGNARLMLWDVSITAWQALGCSVGGRNLTLFEWDKYLPGWPYRKTCQQYG